MMSNMFLAFIIIVYGVCFIPSLRTAIAFWLHRNNDATAYMAMQHGFLMGFLKIWIIYPFFIVKDCINSLKGKD